jgi:hypothetical protein
MKRRRPRAPMKPTQKRTNYPTPELMREIAADLEKRGDTDARDFALQAAESLEQKGWFVSESGDTVLLTEATARQIEVKAALIIAEEPVVPGWVHEFEGKFTMGADGPEPVTYFAPAEGRYDSHAEAVLAAGAAMLGAGIDAFPVPPEMKRLSKVYWLPEAHP